MDERYSTNATDFNSLLSQIKSKNVDAVLVAGHETEILNFVRQAKSLAVAPKMYSFTVGVPSEDFRKALGKDADYAFGMTAWLPSADLKDRWFGDAAAVRQAEYKAQVRLRAGLPRRIRRGRCRGAGAGDRRRRQHRSGRRCATRWRRSSSTASTARSRSAANGQIDLPQVVIQVQGDKLAAGLRRQGLRRRSRNTRCRPGTRAKTPRTRRTGDGSVDLLAQILVNGILLGGLYAVMALGLALVWGVLNIVNLAHGAFIMLGAYAAWHLYHGSPASIRSSACRSPRSSMFALGYALQRGTAEPRRARADVQHAADHLRSRGRDDLSARNSRFRPISAPSIRPMPAATSRSARWRCRWCGLRRSASRIVLTVGMWLFLLHTRLGRAIRATAQNLVAARLYGVEPRHLYAMTFGLGVALAGASRRALRHGLADQSRTSARR